MNLQRILNSRTPSVLWDTSLGLTIFQLILNELSKYNANLNERLEKEFNTISEIVVEKPGELRIYGFKNNISKNILIKLDFNSF